ncbi:MAG: FkbM family methyltransferase [Acidobacteriota bacterium]|nr:FkbM family methyltransferase [Acidobacteriota bacterium]
MEHDPLSDLFHRARTAAPQPSSWGKEEILAIYGAGGFGHKILKALHNRSMPVACLIDRTARPGQHLDGVPVVHPDSIQPAQWATMAILIGIHNPGASVRQLQDDLQARGCLRVFTPVDICNRLGPAFGTHYWLGPSTHYLESEREIRLAREIIAPDSLALFDAVLAQRVSGDYHLLPDPTHEIDDYLPVDVAPFVGPVRVVDGGAYDGDTLRGLLAHGFTVESAAAFEPDAENFSKMAAWVRTQPGLEAFLWPCGLFSHPAQLRFSAGQGEASAITSEGDMMIQCVSVDEALHGFRPTLLKLDVEGAEPEALRGARNTIRAHQPFITAGLYHHPSHLWEVPLLLRSIHPGYRLHLRSHAHNGFELWLHAIPEGGIA